MPQSEPLLSLVVTSRNDDHGGTLQRRMQTFTNHFIGQCVRHGLSAELIIVEWNPLADRPRLSEALRWPRNFGPCQVRIIEVPAKVHRRLRHSEALPLFQMIGKNVGIRRARGKFVVATNIDILFSDEMVRFILQGNLKSDRMYRVDRMDVMTHVPVDAPVEDQLAYCRSHYLRRNAREGTYRLNPDGSEYHDPEDVFDPSSGIVPEEGFCPMERLRDQTVRWVAPQSSLRVTAPRTPSPLVLEIEPGPAAGYQPIQLNVYDDKDRLLVRAHVEGRQFVTMQLPLEPGETATYSLRVPQHAPLRGLDPRNLAFGLFRCAWSNEPMPSLPGHPDDLNCAVTGSGTLYPVDVATPSDGLRFGKGFWPPEPEPTERFRWVGPEATLIMRAPENCPPLLCLELKDGPSLARPKLELEIQDYNSGMTTHATVEGRSRIYVRLPWTPERSQHLGLRVHGDLAPLPGDPRHLCFGLYRCTWVHAPETTGLIETPGKCIVEEVSELEREDIVSPEAGIRFAAGFAEPATYAGERFRWARDRAKLVLAAPKGTVRTLALVVETGPRANYEAIELEAHTPDGTVLARGTIEGRQKVYLSLPSSTEANRVIELHAVPHSASPMLRPMTFRVFECGWVDGPLPAASGMNFAVEPANPSQVWDAAGTGKGVWFGRCWYPEEKYAGETFRWGKNGAVLQVVTPQNQKSQLSLLVDPARPCGDTGPVRLQLRALEGEVLSEVTITEKQVVSFPLPTDGRAQTLSLHSDREPLLNPQDPRPLSFRVMMPVKPPLVTAEPLASRPGNLIHRIWNRFRAILETKGMTATSSKEGSAQVGNPVSESLSATGRPAATSSAPAPDQLPPIPNRDSLPDAPPDFLHTNACGDFTMLAREHWFALRGYPEVEMYSLHIDSLFCYMAHYAGVREEMLSDPMQVYHIEHSAGSGWTPEGADKLMQRMAARGIPVIDCQDLFRWGSHMRYNGVVLFNGEDWGFAKKVLPETKLQTQTAQAA